MRLGSPSLRHSFSTVGGYGGLLDLPCLAPKLASHNMVDAPRDGSRFFGPCTITKVDNRSAVRLNLSTTLLRINPTFHVSRVKPFVTELPDYSPKPPPPPRLVDGSETFTVRRLLDVRRRGRSFQYLVDWEGYRPEERCWVPARDILDPKLIASFWRQLPTLPRKNARRRS